MDYNETDRAYWDSHTSDGASPGDNEKEQS